MDYPSLVIGIFALGFGLYTLILRMTDPSKFGKLQAMKKLYGETAGNVVHIIAYTLLPLLIGITASAEFPFWGRRPRTVFPPGLVPSGNYAKD